MGTLNTIEDKVKLLLEQYPETRKSDKILYLAFLKKYRFRTDITLQEFLLDKTYPSFDSISRVRRKMQSTNPDLVNSGVKSLRHKNEMEFFNYAMQDKNGR